MAYTRFLTNNDYCSIATEEHMKMIERDMPERIPQAEQRAEMNFLEYLDQYYDIRRVLAIGKNIREYNEAVSYPCGVWIKLDEKIYKTLAIINGVKAPTKNVYWEQVVDYIDPILVEKARKYSQLRMYAKGEIVIFGTEYWRCLIPHGYDAGDIHMPGVITWKEADITAWEPNMEWAKDQVCSYNDKFYQFIGKDETDTGGGGNTEGGDNGSTDTNTGTGTDNNSGTEGGDKTETSDETIPDGTTDNGTDGSGDGKGEESTGGDITPTPVLTPEEDEEWGLIADYDKEYNYNFDEDTKDYVVAEGTVFYPVMNPNADKPEIGVNITADDPRHPAVVAHMARISLYYLHQIISPTNISETRRWAYEDSMKWLSDASRFKINPQLPRRKDCETGEDKVDWALETFQKSYNPFENPWLI